MRKNKTHLYRNLWISVDTLSNFEGQPFSILNRDRYILTDFYIAAPIFKKIRTSHFIYDAIKIRSDEE